MTVRAVQVNEQRPQGHVFGGFTRKIPMAHSRVDQMAFKATVIPGIYLMVLEFREQLLCQLL